MERKTWMCAALALVLALPVLSLPALGQQVGSDSDEAKEDGHAQVEARRVVMVPRVEVEGTEGGDVRFEPNVRVIVRTDDEDDGETYQYSWQGQDGEVFELKGGHGEFLYAPGAKRGYLGVELTDLTPELRRHFGAPEDTGLLVGRVAPDSPAEKAGLEVGDVLTRLDGEKVGSSLAATARIGQREEGDLVNVEVVRGGLVQTLSATLETRRRAQIEVGHLLRRIGEEGEGLHYEFNPEVFEHHIEGMRGYFSGPEWRTQVMEMEGVEEGLRDRLERLEVELKEIQDRLEITIELEEDDGEAP